MSVSNLFTPNGIELNAKSLTCETVNATSISATNLIFENEQLSNLEVLNHLQVDGSANISHDTTIGGNLSVSQITGDTTMDGNVSVSGTLSTPSLSATTGIVSGNLTVGGTLTAPNFIITNESVNNLTVNNNMSVGGTTSVNNLNVSGTLSQTDISTQDLTVEQNAIFKRAIVLGTDGSASGEIRSVGDMVSFFSGASGKLHFGKNSFTAGTTV
jgi:cytoskeletal protein CcmA (bactofilin family)